MATATLIKNNNGVAKNLKAVDYGLIKITSAKPTVKINSILPFRVKFSNITVPGYGPNNPAPIGIAIIGFNNYIL
jgi:hypothetical protein